MLADSRKLRKWWRGLPLDQSVVAVRRDAPLLPSGGNAVLQVLLRFDGRLDSVQSFFHCTHFRIASARTRFGPSPSSYFRSAVAESIRLVSSAIAVLCRDSARSSWGGSVRTATTGGSEPFLKGSAPTPGTACAKEEAVITMASTHFIIKAYAGRTSLRDGSHTESHACSGTGAGKNPKSPVTLK
jgi:hypothetical protein